MEPLANRNFEEFAKSEERGAAFSFKAIKPTFDFIQDIAKRLVSYENVDGIPVKNIDKLNNAAGKLNSAIEQINAFNVNSGNATQNQKQNLINQFDEYASAFIDEASISLSLFSDSREKLEQVILELKQIVENSKGDLAALSELKKDAKKSAGDLKLLLNSSREDAQKKTVAVHAGHFKDESLIHAEEAKGWLVKSYWSFGVIAAWGIGLCVLPILLPENDSAYYITQMAIGKLVVSSTLFVMLYTCLKNYKAARHNVVVNKHKSNALDTFDTFVLSASADPQTKNAVLLHSASCIFAPQPTGYGDGGDGDSTNHVLEIVKSVSSIGSNKA